MTEETPPEGYGNLAGKAALFCGDRILTMRRDDLAHIPYPAHWDLPGGEIDPGETPLDCVVREVAEEVGLSLPAERFMLYGWRIWADRPDKLMWYFTVELDENEAASARLGEEGTELALRPVADFVNDPLTVPAFRHIVGEMWQITTMP